MVSTIDSSAMMTPIERKSKGKNCVRTVANLVVASGITYGSYKMYNGIKNADSEKWLGQNRDKIKNWVNKNTAGIKEKAPQWSKNWYHKSSDFIKKLPKPIKAVALTLTALIGISHFKRSGEIQQQNKIIDEINQYYC